MKSELKAAADMIKDIDEDNISLAHDSKFSQPVQSEKNVEHLKPSTTAKPTTNHKTPIITPSKRHNNRKVSTGNVNTEQSKSTNNVSNASSKQSNSSMKTVSSSKAPAKSPATSTTAQKPLSKAVQLMEQTKAPEDKQHLPNHTHSSTGLASMNRTLDAVSIDSRISAITEESETGVDFYEQLMAKYGIELSDDDDDDG